MPPPFKQVTLPQFEALLREFPFQRRIDSVHMHHTWRPNHAQYRGHETIVGMWRSHTTDNGWRDIAQHLSISPDGSLWLGRGWNLPPASAGGHNGSAAAGPFMFEMIGDFDAGRDPFGGAQKDAALRVVALVQDRFGLQVGTLRFHNQMSSKTCPGSTINYGAILEEVGALRWQEAAPEAGAGAEVGSLVLDLLRGELAVTAGEVATGELAEDEGGPPPRPRRGATAELGGRDDALTIDEMEALRGHVVNLSRGRLSTSGRFATTNDDVDAIFGENLERAVEARQGDGPLRVVIWAHGGLVDELHGLRIAHKHVRWWLSHGVYPLYFVWETGFLEALGRVLTGRSGGPEGVLADRLSEARDKAVEELAWRLGGPAIWSDMKQGARLAVDPQEGGASYVAEKLGAFCQRHGEAVELHAVGHSAGAVFHTSFLPAAVERGVLQFRSLALLAPAVRVDRFLERLAPIIGPGAAVESIVLFTMNRLREVEDTCAGVYGKSLLYLIHHALEDRREVPILGLEMSLRADPELRRLFNLGGESGGIGEVVWSKSPPEAPARSRSGSVTHGGFDDDPATMDSLMRRVLGRDDVTPGYSAVGEVGLDATMDRAADARIALGSEGTGGAADAEGYGVPFDVLDAFERAAEAALGEVEAELAAEAGGRIDFGPNARSGDVTDYSRGVLQDVMRAARVGSVRISSTSRGPADQARVMFANLRSFGVAHQRRLYGPAGDQVIDIYERETRAGRDDAAVRVAMTAEIVRIGPTKVSRHAADPRVLNVFDVAPSSVDRPAAFEAAVRAERRVARFLKPPEDPGYHLEIPQLGGGSP